MLKYHAKISKEGGSKNKWFLALDIHGLWIWTEYVQITLIKLTIRWLHSRFVTFVILQICLFIMWNINETRGYLLDNGFPISMRAVIVNVKYLINGVFETRWSRQETLLHCFNRVAIFRCQFIIKWSPSFDKAVSPSILLGGLEIREFTRYWGFPGVADVHSVTRRRSSLLEERPWTLIFVQCEEMSTWWRSNGEDS